MVFAKVFESFYGTFLGFVQGFPNVSMGWVQGSPARFDHPKAPPIHPLRVKLDSMGATKICVFETSKYCKNLHVKPPAYSSLLHSQR